jgi:sugar fermentation stimulation protein A
VRFEDHLVTAVFKARLNRFLGVVQIDREQNLCFIPNPGRMEELLHPGTKVYLIKKSPENRKTQYDLVIVDHNGTLVSIDSRVPNRVIAEAIESNRLQEFHGMNIAEREHTFGDSRLDFLLRSGLGQLLLEVKSCTLVRDETGFFPDAPTARGRRHLRILMDGLAEGRAAVLFLIQRPDAECLRSNETTDPEFAETLREAARTGVEVYAYNSNVTLDGVFIKRKVPVLL